MNALSSVEQVPIVEQAGAVLVSAVASAGTLPWWLRVVHAAIIANLAIQCLYIVWQVFVVLQPPGVIGPLFGAAIALPPEIMLARRTYAQEGWMAFCGLALYLGVTEVAPRRRRQH